MVRTYGMDNKTSGSFNINGDTMKIYVLTLENETERQKNVIKEFQKIDVPFNFFKGMDARKLSSDKLKKLCVNEAMLAGEIGCAESHLQIMRDFLKTEENSVFIFEDDVQFSKKVNKNVLKEFKKFIDSKNTPSVIILRKRKRLGKKVYRIGNIPVYECYRATGAISYLINRKCAEFLVKNNTPIRFQSDAWSIYAPSKLINLYALNEDLCSEWNGPNGIYKSTVGISAKRACHSSKHKKLKNQFLKEHGYTKFNWICDSIKSYYYSLKRKL